MLPVLLLVTAFIVYGSLYPWQFHAAVIPGNPLWILLHSWSYELNRYLLKDTGVNLVLYIPFGAACYLSLARRPLPVKVGAPLLLALSLSSSLEMIQLFDGLRVCSMLDVVTNLTGAALGIAIASQFQAAVSIHPRAAGPLLLLSCWLGALLFPFMPDLSTHHLISKISAFTAPSFAPVEFFNLLVMWLAAARLVEKASARLLVPLLLLVLPLRLFVEGITLAWTDCSPAILAMAIWYLWSPRWLHRDATLAGISIAAILLTGLSPFRFAPVSQGFSWIPFRALFSADWQTGFSIFFRKSFAYGSAIWFLTAAGVSSVMAALSMAALLAALEGSQLRLPNHVAESTDPLHALILAWVLQRVKPIPKPVPATDTRLNASVRL